MAEFLATLQSLFTFAFVVSSMLAMGLSLTVGQIVEPLRSVRLVLLALLAKLRGSARRARVSRGRWAHRHGVVIPLAAEFGKTPGRPARGWPRGDAFTVES